MTSRLVNAFVPRDGDDGPLVRSQVGRAAPVRNKADASPTVQRIFKRGLQRFTAEHAGKIDQRPRRAGHGNTIPQSSVPLCNLTPVDNDSRRLQPTLARDPDMDASLNDRVNPPEVRRRRVRSNGAITSPEHSRKCRLPHGPGNEGRPIDAREDTLQLPGPHAAAQCRRAESHRSYLFRRHETVLTRQCGTQCALIGARVSLSGTHAPTRAPRYDKRPAVAEVAPGPGGDRSAPGQAQPGHERERGRRRSRVRTGRPKGDRAYV
jgi:hypothetical protein